MTAVAGHVTAGPRRPPWTAGCARTRGGGAPAGRRDRAARRVPRLRLQAAAFAGAAGRRPGHPDVGAAVRGDLPDRRLPRLAAIAELVSGDLGRSLTADPVRYLITAKLLPLGVVVAGGARPPRRRPARCSRCQARGTLLPERVVNLVGTLLRPLFRWPVVVAVVGSVAAIDYWLFVVHGLGGGMQQVLRDPADLLVVLGLSLAPPCSTSAGTPPAAVTAAPGQARSAWASTWSGRVLYQRHRLLPAQQQGGCGPTSAACTST